ncbi:hypothetical protein [uncultured Corynebacterium sp.]|uniref:hypothetical protein n=1 Tax=uncultured Corynebacterium sp. TaxID=159447 RepID=UPI0025D6BAF6|nr:hypothetical protein [uncultured Corynebacterium sp.]
MTSTQHTTTPTTAPPAPGDVPESFGARLARETREAQGLSPGIVDRRARARLRALCGLPKPPLTLSRTPDELDPAGE